MRILLDRRAQSLLEYALLVIVITSALLAMYPYMRRAVNAKLKHVQIELNEWKR
ncbi:MAG: hypothetical protein PHT31_05445 [Candidatus Omnitrophica bacterium]|nr:hypothetical protein [Candidatus Omnitrophota bacterium]MDD5653584.1 hypothetical protein [Candidatus Omnitrophota bacterium]